MKSKKLRELISWLLCLCMVAGLLPTAALAADVPAITTDTLEAATVGVYYETTLTATASDQNGELTWEAEGLPNGLALSGSGETAALLGTPIEAGTFTVTVTVTETIPAAEPEEPAEEPAAEEGETPADAPQPTLLTAVQEYTLTVAEAVQAEPEPEPEPEPASEPAQEPAQEPADEPAANAPLTDGAGATRGITADGTVSATIYTRQNGQGGFEDETSTFPVDQSGLILDLRSFNAAVPSGWEVESIAFYPTDGSSEWGSVFWFNGTAEYPCNNGTASDKLYVEGNYNGVFQILDFTPNGNSDSAELTPGTYKILVYVGNGLDYPNYEETLYLSKETFTITKAAGPGVPVITTATLPDATVGVSYEATLAANAATGGSLSWALASGSSLPNGLQLDTNTGKISGIPTAAGSSTFTVQVTETPAEGGEALVGTKALTLTVKEPTGPVITTTELPLAFIGGSYTAQLAATAGSDGSLSWSITSDNKPDWLTLDADTGALSGAVPDNAATGPISLTFQVTETLGGDITRTAEKTLALTVTKKLEITNTVTSFNPTRGQTFSLTLEANLEDVTWSRKSGSLPSNLNLTGNTISGTVSAYARDGEYTYTVIARSPDGQTAEKTFTFTVGSLFYFTLPADLDDDAFGRSASLKATLDGKEVTLWSGKLTGQGQTLTVNSAYAGEQVTDVKLTTYLNRGEVVLAEKTGNTELKDSDSAELTAKPDPIITLPAFTYDGLDDYVSAWFVDSSGWRYNSGDLAASSETFTLKASANAYQYRSSGNADYDLSGTPSFSGTGVGGDSYTPSSGDGSAIAVTYLRLTKKTVTFTLQLMEGGTTGTEVALNRASLSITQYVNGQSVRTTAQIQNNTTATAELYTGLEANLSLLSAPGCYLKEPKIERVDTTHALTYYTSEHTQAALLITPKLANESEDLLAYAKNLPGSKLTPTITVDSDSWMINSVQAVQYVGRSVSSRIWNNTHVDSIKALAADGSAYSLSWPAYQGLLAGSLTGQKWPESQLNAAAEVNIDLKGGVLLSLTNSDNTSAALQDWWYQEDTDGNGTWITSGRTTTLSGSSNYSFYCPGNNGAYGFLLLPREAQPIGMNWEEAAAHFTGMPALEEVNVQDNKVTTGEFAISKVETANARYLTLPNSTLSGPAQFTSTEELLSFTGGIQLDKGVDGKLESLRIDAAGDDNKVAFQISSLQINGKSYNYAGIHLQSDTLPKDTLMSKQFTTYYQIDFSEPISLPCTFTVYGTAMTANSDVKLSPTVELTNVKGVDTSKVDPWQPLGTVTAQAPALSVSLPASTGMDVVPAYLTIPGYGGTVDIYDGETLVVSGAREGEVEIPLEKISSSRTTSHDLSFRWNKKPSGMENVSDVPYEVTVLHTNGLPTLVSQQLQISNNLERDLWSTCSRDHIYSYPSASPPYFRAVCEIAHYDNIKGGITFLFQLLDGTTVTQTGAGAALTDSNGDIWTITSNSFRSSSPVIGVSVLFEVDWDKVNDFLEYNAPKLPNDSPSRNITEEVFTETVVIPSREHNIQFSQLPEKLPEISTEEMPSQEDLWEQIQELQGEIEAIYARDGGQAGFYIIDLGNDQFLPALDMINGLDTGYIPQGDTGTTTMTRELSSTELTTELGSGEWSRYAFTEPGEIGSGEATGMEVYTQSVTTESGVQASITIATDGNTTVEFAMAQGTGTGTNPYTLPESGTYPSGGTSSGGVGGFSFTTFESDGMSVFSNVCGDVTTGSNTIKDITAAVTGAEATGLFKPLEQGLGAYSFTKDMMDGVSNEITLMDLLNAPNKWLSSPCAQKLSNGFRTNMQNQINNFIKDVRDAEGWNMAVTGANYVLGAGGLVGMFSNPFTATVSVVGGVGSWLAGKLTSQKIDNVQRQAAVLKDTIDLQITATAIRNNDRECMPKYNGADPANRGAGSGYGTGSGRGGSTAPYRVCIDPSGIVYEAVLSNPVKDATVTLYTDGINYTPEYATAKDNNGEDTKIQIMVGNDGKPIAPSNADRASDATLTTPVDSTIPAETVLTTGADGRFQWMVEQGLWYVTASKDGYESGDSGRDVAAVVKAGGRNWLPVAPEQLNVNIPLVSYEAPTVTVEARSDGVYLTFSKYMDDTTLTANNFTLTDSDGKEISITDVKLLNSEQAPSNIDYDGDAPWYTSQVKLAVAEDTTLSGKVTVAISSNVLSYAGVPRRDRTASGTVQEGTLTVEVPEVDGKTGQVEYGTTVTLTIPDGAVVYYTTDGSRPSYDDNGQPTGSTIRYYEGQPIVITRTMTIRAVAVMYGERSEVVSEKFTVSGTGGGIPEVPDDPDDPDDEPDTPATPGGTTGGGSSGYAVSVPASSSIRGGSITVSPRSAEKGDTVTITVKPDDGYELSKLTVTDAKGNELELTDKGSGKYTFAMPGSSVKVQVSFKEIAAQAVNPFTDVAANAYYYDAVLWAVANGVTNGTSATTFSPDVTVTRAQMVTFLWRAYGSPRATGSNPFTDVSADAYYYDAVLWAVANGITNGTTATTFCPNAPVTRAQAVTFQWRTAGSPAVSGGSFSDVAASAYYSGAVAWAVANGITNGTTATTFSPDTPVSRAQAVTFLYRELA